MAPRSTFRLGDQATFIIEAQGPPKSFSTSSVPHHPDRMESKLHESMHRASNSNSPISPKNNSTMDLNELFRLYLETSACSTCPETEKSALLARLSSETNKEAKQSVEQMELFLEQEDALSIIAPSADYRTESRDRMLHDRNDFPFVSERDVYRCQLLL